MAAECPRPGPARVWWEISFHLIQGHFKESPTDEPQESALQGRPLITETHSPAVGPGMLQEQECLGAGVGG